MTDAAPLAGARNPGKSGVSRPSRAVLVGLSALLGVLLALPWVLYQRMHPAADVQTLGDAPQWQLTNQNGAPFGSSQLAGKPHVISFFFTSCPSTCPKIMGAMAKVQDRTDLQLVSISVDPLTDTPDVLKAALPKYGGRPDRWTLCTGTEEAVHKVVVDGFATYVGKKVQKSATVYDIAHGARLVLVDGDGKVRGHFSTDELGLSELERAAKEL